MRDFGGEISSMLAGLKCLDRLCLNTFLFFALSFSFANYWSVANAQQPETTTEQITNSSDGVSETQEQTASVNVRLRALQERINELKENVFRSKARLVLLRETVLNSSLSGSQLVIHHRNEMGSSYRIQRVRYLLDGEPIFDKSKKDSEIKDQVQIAVFDGNVPPGIHNLSAYIEYRGHGYGVFYISQ